MIDTHTRMDAELSFNQKKNRILIDLLMRYRNTDAMIVAILVL